MTCACGYYSVCFQGCSPERIKLLIAARERVWEDEELQPALQKEYERDWAEDKKGEYR